MVTFLCVRTTATFPFENILPANSSLPSYIMVYPVLCASFGVSGPEYPSIHPSDLGIPGQPLACGTGKRSPPGHSPYWDLAEQTNKWKGWYTTPTLPVFLAKHAW